MRGGNRESALVNLRIDPFSIITLLWTAFAALWVVGVVLVLLARGSVGRRERGWRRAGQSLCKGALGASVVLFIFFTATSSDWLWAAIAILVAASLLQVWRYGRSGMSPVMCFVAGGDRKSVV